jgi:flagellar hook protein FlgE
MFSAVSGLRNHQVRMDVIGNNISNVNTVGYKSSRVTFQDLFSQTIQDASSGFGNSGGTNPVQVGLGSKIGTVDTLFTQGSIQTTGRTFDLAIEGDGYFELSNSNTAGGDSFYTRAGNFDIDANGFLVNPSNGYFVQGLLGDAQGEIDRTQAPQAIQVDFGEVSPAIVTRNIRLGGNLNANTRPQGASALNDIRSLFNEEGEVANLRIGDVIRFETGTIDPAGVNTDLSGTEILTVDSDTTLQNLVTQIQNRLRDPNNDGSTADGDPSASVIINSDGSLRFISGGLELTDLKFEVVDDTGTPLATQTAFLQSVLTDGDATDGDADDIDVGAALQQDTDKIFRQADVTTSIDVFDSQGNARTVTVAFAKDSTATNTFNWQAIVPHVDGNVATGSFPTGDNGTLIFGSNGLLDEDATGIVAPLIFDPDGTGPENGGVDSLQIDLDFTNVTQFAATESTATIEEQDGTPQGVLDSIAIDRRGIIRGLFTNGVTRDLAQVLTATVTNEEGLFKVGENLFQTSPNTGTAVLGEPTARGRGAIASGTLELSNVDLATEFTDMIITQRGFQANARVITTGDEMLNELVNIV